MKPVIDEATARDAIASWAEWAEVDLAEQEVKLLLPATTRGRVVLDEDEGVFTITLRSPIELDNGMMVESVKIREPKTSEVKKSSGQKSDMDIAIHLISIMTGHPVGVIERIGLKDLNVLGQIVGFFG